MNGVPYEARATGPKVLEDFLVNNDDPVVDVIIPTRDRPELTAEAIQSVIGQTFTRWRLLLVDDGSHEANADALRSIAAKDPRITLIRRDVSGGAQHARQVGLEASHAPLIAALDSDDLWSPEKLELQVTQFRQDQATIDDLGAVLCWFFWVDSSGRVTATRTPRVRGQASPWVSDNMSAFLVTREALMRAAGFLPPGTTYKPGASHIDFYLRLTQSCNFTTVEQVLVTCRTHQGERQSDVLRTRIGADNLASLLEVHASTLRRHPPDRARLEARVGARYLAVGDRKTGMRYTKAAFRDVDLGTRLQLLRQYGPHTVRRLLRG